MGKNKSKQSKSKQSKNSAKHYRYLRNGDDDKNKTRQGRNKTILLLVRQDKKNKGKTSTTF